MLFDSLIRYGALAGIAVAVALALSWLYEPLAIWVLLIIYCFVRMQVQPRGPQKDADSWQRELAQMERTAAANSAAYGNGGILPGEKDAHLEALMAAKNFAVALKFAREHAALALSRRDFERARVYEKYLDRLRRGAG